MIRNLAVAAGLTVLSAIGFASSASAQVASTQDVNFNGNIPSVCTFTNKTDGILQQPDPNVDWIEGTSGIPGLNVGTAGSVTVNCNNGGSLRVAAPVKINTPTAFAPDVEQSVVYDGTNYTNANTGSNFDTGAWDKPTTPLTIPSRTDVNLTVSMIAGTKTFTGTMPPGNYSYRVTLTATPN